VGKIALAGTALVATMMAPKAAHASSNTGGNNGGGSTGLQQIGTVDKAKQLASKLPAKLIK
jgi:hypothetical protein